MKEGAWPERGLALLRKKVKEHWTEKHRIVARKIFLFWESEKPQSWGMQVEGFRGRVATDGLLLGATENWGACGWAVVQLDYDEEMVPLHGMWGSMEAEYEVQRTIKRAELTGYLCHLRKSEWTNQGPCGQQGNDRWVTKR